MSGDTVPRWPVERVRSLLVKSTTCYNTQARTGDKMKNATFRIKISGSNRNGQMFRTVTTEPVHQGIIDQISPRLSSILLLDKEVAAVEMTFTVKRGDKSQMIHENVMPETVQLERHFMEWLESLAHRGFLEVEQFEQAMVAFQPDAHQVTALVRQILGKPELGGDIETMTVEVKPCERCSRFHHDAHMEIMGLDEAPADIRDMVKGLFGRLSGMFGARQRNGKDGGLTFRISDPGIGNSPFAALASERLKPMVVKAVRDGVTAAFTSNVEALAANVERIDDAKRQLEEELVRFAEVRAQQLGKAVKLKELAVALGEHGIEGLSVAELETGPFTEALPAATAQPVAHPTQGNGDGTPATAA